MSSFIFCFVLANIRFLLRMILRQLQWKHHEWKGSIMDEGSIVDEGSIMDEIGASWTKEKHRGRRGSSWNTLDYQGSLYYLSLLFFFLWNKINAFSLFFFITIGFYFLYFDHDSFVILGDSGCNALTLILIFWSNCWFLLLWIWVWFCLVILNMASLHC